MFFFLHIQLNMCRCGRFGIILERASIFNILYNTMNRQEEKAVTCLCMRMRLWHFDYIIGMGLNSIWILTKALITIVQNTSTSSNLIGQLTWLSVLYNNINRSTWFWMVATHPPPSSTYSFNCWIQFMFICDLYGRTRTYIIYNALIDWILWNSMRQWYGWFCDIEEYHNQIT